MSKLSINIIILLFLTISCDNYQAPDPNVKKSSTGICHKKHSQYYKQTKKYNSFDTIRDCLDSGRRLPN